MFMSPNVSGLDPCTKNEIQHTLKHYFLSRIKSYHSTSQSHETSINTDGQKISYKGKKQGIVYVN